MVTIDPTARSLETSRALIRVKDGKCRMAYCRSMAALLFRLLAALALIAMPWGMANANPQATSSTATVKMGHCADDSQPSHAPSRQDGHCAACVVLTGNGAALNPAELKPEAPLAVQLTELSVGLELEVATPPPKSV